jgi:hypothetical protein
VPKSKRKPRPLRYHRKYKLPKTPTELGYSV